MPKKPRAVCLSCRRHVGRLSYTYCSNQCHSDHRYKSYIRRWQRGEVTGLQPLGLVSHHIKRYLREKFNNIDGNWRNNVENNLRLICPNCDALSATYAGLNRGRGRKNRPLSKRGQEGRLFVGQ